MARLADPNYELLAAMRELKLDAWVRHPLTAARGRVKLEGGPARREIPVIIRDERRRDGAAPMAGLAALAAATAAATLATREPEARSSRGVAELLAALFRVPAKAPPARRWGAAVVAVGVALLGVAAIAEITRRR